MLLYFLWDGGDYRGGEIGKVFGLGESSVSRRARMAKEKLEKDKKFRGRFEKIKSIIKVTPIACSSEFNHKAPPC